jgi:tRNA nucleotidyltransferase (CCA-adding enzyme)
MQFGTPFQDALRRDLTINALFYNINEQRVEDFTGKGLEDLKEGIIRTPLEPRTTFIDDPLRVMRAIRFGTRFGYRFDADLVRAAQLADVKDALMSKVSRERIGQELFGIFQPGRRAARRAPRRRRLACV